MKHDPLTETMFRMTGDADREVAQEIVDLVHERVPHGGAAFATIVTALVALSIAMTRNSEFDGIDGVITQKTLFTNFYLFTALRMLETSDADE